MASGTGILFCVILTLSLPLTIFANGVGYECDMSQGEVFLAAVDQVSNYAECKKSCEDEAKCRGVTFYGTVNNPGSCVHFSTECKNTRPSEDGDTIAATVTKECDAPAACKVEKNFIYRGDAITPKPSGKFPTAKDCNAECLKRINCKFWWWSKISSQTTCFLLKNFKSKVDSSMFNFHSVVAGNRCEAAPKHPAKPAEGISCWKKLCNSCEYSGSERRVSTGGTLAACQASCAADPKCKAIDFGKGSRAKQCYHNYDSNGSGHGHGSFDSYINKCPAKPAPAKPAPKTCWKRTCKVSCNFSGRERRVSTGGTLAACQASCKADPKCTAIDFGKGSRAKQCYHNYDGDGTGHGDPNFDSYYQTNCVSRNNIRYGCGTIFTCSANHMREARWNY